MRASLLGVIGRIAIVIFSAQAAIIVWLTVVGARSTGVVFGVVEAALVVLIAAPTVAYWVVRPLLARAQEEAGGRVVDLAPIGTPGAPGYDPATGLPNEALMQDRLKMAMAHANRAGTSAALMCLEVVQGANADGGGGKPVDRTVIRDVARYIGGTVRETDTAAYLGRNRFGIVLFDLADPEHAPIAADRLRLAVRGCGQSYDPILNLSINVGIAAYPVHARTVADLVRLSEAALDRVRVTGNPRDCFPEAFVPADRAARPQRQFGRRKTDPPEQQMAAQARRRTDRVPDFSDH